MSHLVTRRLIIAMLVALGAAIVYVLFSATGKPAPTHPYERFKAGALTKLDFAYAGELPDSSAFNGPDGETLTLASLKGRVTLVNFWATWCAPCEREMPSLGALQTGLGGEDFQIIAVSVDGEEDKAHAESQLNTWTGGTLGFYHTPEYALTYDVGIRGFPTTILYAPDGHEIARLEGELDWASIEAVGFIRAVIDGESETPRA